jgi:hypothetical protein
VSNPSPEYLAAMTKEEYPFSAFYTVPAFNRAFSDLYLQLATAAAGLRVRSFASSSGVVRIVIEDEDAELVADTDEADETTTDVFGAWTIMTWVWPLSDGADSGAVLTIVLNTENFAALGDVSYTEMALGLQIRNTTARVPRLDSLVIDDPDLGLTAVTGDVVLVAGNNTQLVRRDNEIDVAFVPGAGAGKNTKDCSETDNFVRSIGNVVADEFGNVSLLPGDCYTWTSFENGTVVLNGNCKTCFSCEDLETAYAALTQQYARALNTRQRLANVIAVYEDLLADVRAFKGSLDQTKIVVAIEQTTARTAAISVRLQAGRYTESGVEQAVSFVQATLTFSTGDVTIVPFSGKRKLPGLALSTWNGMAGNGTGFTYDGTPVVVLPGRYASWYYAVDVALPPSASEAPVDVTVSGSVKLKFANGTELTFPVDATTLAIVPPGVEE